MWHGVNLARGIAAGGVCAVVLALVITHQTNAVGAVSMALVGALAVFFKGGDGNGKDAQS